MGEPTGRLESCSGSRQRAEGLGGAIGGAIAASQDANLSELAEPATELQERQRQLHERVLALLEQQRAKLCSGEWDELMRINEQLEQAIDEAREAVRQRAGLKRRLGRRSWEAHLESDASVRRLCRLIQTQAEINESLAAELSAEAQFLMDCLVGACEYDRNGLPTARGVTLLDRAV